MYQRNFDTKLTDWQKSLPIPVYDRNPEYVDFYFRTWEIARKNLQDIPGMPQTPYMDEGLIKSDIWIWDTCFMTFFCKYAPDVFPGIETLNNFYMPLHDKIPLPKVTFDKPSPWNMYKAGETTQLKLHIPDNPPLFSWAEYSYAMMTGDREHLKTLLLEKQYLQRHFEFLENLTEAGFVTEYTRAPTCWIKHEHGYFWEGGRSGMDNTPRGRHGIHAEKDRPEKSDLLWIDAIAQQGLNALYIAKIAELLEEPEIAAKYRAIHQQLTAKVNELYWDENDGIYYDINYLTLAKNRCLTPASFWPLLAEMPDARQTAKMCKLVEDPAKFGGKVPWKTLVPDDPDYSPSGNYWRGSMWLPTAYMGCKALESCGRFDLAGECAENIVAHQYKTWKEYTPHTVWECYSPEKAEPATRNDLNERVRPDFCGWSALGPIALLLENVIGITGANAFKNELHWHTPKTVSGALGVRNYSFGDIKTDLIRSGNTIAAKSNAPYTLIVDGKSVAVNSGETVITL